MIGTVSAWTRRYCPILFAGSEQHAAELAWRFLAGQVNETWKIVKAIELEVT